MRGQIYTHQEIVDFITLEHIERLYAEYKSKVVLNFANGLSPDDYVLKNVNEELIDVEAVFAQCDVYRQKGWNHNDNLGPTEHVGHYWQTAHEYEQKVWQLYSQRTSRVFGISMTLTEDGPVVTNDMSMTSDRMKAINEMMGKPLVESHHQGYDKEYDPFYDEDDNEET